MAMKVMIVPALEAPQLKKMFEWKALTAEPLLLEENMQCMSAVALKDIDVAVPRCSTGSLRSTARVFDESAGFPKRKLGWCHIHLGLDLLANAPTPTVEGFEVYRRRHLHCCHIPRVLPGLASNLLACSTTTCRLEERRIE
jgi:hypothetical protein